VSAVDLDDLAFRREVLTEDQGNNLIFAIISDSYEEYAMRCAMAGVEPTVSPGAFRLNRDKAVQDKISTV